MANQENSTFVENVVNAQKQMVDTMVENTRKFAGGIPFLGDTLQQGSDWYKNWLDNQQQVFTKTTEQANAATETVKNNANQMNDFYQNWYNNQLSWAKQMWEQGASWMNPAQQQATANNANPAAQWGAMMNNWTNTWNNWVSGINNTANWANSMNQFQQFNPFNQDNWKQATDSYSTILNQWYELLSNNFTEWQKNFQNGTIQDAYRNLLNTTEGFNRFSQVWAPMWNAVQDKTFNMDLYRQWLNPAMYKELMDKFFGFLPENTRQYFQQMTAQMQEGFRQASQMGLQQYQQVRGMMGTNPFLNTGNMFGNVMDAYTHWRNMFTNAVAPVVRIMTPNQQTKAIQEWADIANRMMVFNIKNAELQYKIYNQGTKVMDQLAENIMDKIGKGEEVKSMMTLYQEWMNISDKAYVSLFESDEYSQLMAEVSALQMRLRRDMEQQMEGMLSGVPVATRSEMDELYRTIYDLKKQVRQLEKMMELGAEENPAQSADTKPSATPNNNTINPNNSGNNKAKKA